MLQFRRILAFSSRIHTYLMVLYLFFALLFAVTFFMSVSADLISLLSLLMTVTSWLIIFEGVWIVLASVYQLFYTRVFAFSPVILTLVRCLVTIACAAVIDSINVAVTQGVII